MNPLQKSAHLGFRLLKIAATNPRRLPHILGTALSASHDVVDRSCDLLRLPGVRPVRMILRAPVKAPAVCHAPVPVLVLDFVAIRIGDRTQTQPDLASSRLERGF
jgi:hypothetical protein